MTLFEKLCIRIHQKQGSEVNTNGRWPDGRDDARFYIMIALTIGATWYYRIQLLTGP